MDESGEGKMVKKLFEQGHWQWVEEWAQDIFKRLNEVKILN